MKAPRYIPSEIMRCLTKEQLRILMTQKNSKGKYSQNANRAQKILWQMSGHTSRNTGWSQPLTMHEKTGWEIPKEKTIDLKEWLNGTELIEGRESWI